MENRRCPHISGDPKQRIHTLPCRDVFCFSCLYKIRGLMAGDVFSCPFCGGFSQYINPRVAVLGSNVDAMQHNGSHSICSDSAEGDSHVSKKSSFSSDATEQINLHEKSYVESTLGMNTSNSPKAENHTSSMYKRRHISQKNETLVSGVLADVPPSSSSFPPDDVVGNVTQEELDQQHELLHRFSPAKRSTEPTDSSSDYTNSQATGHKSGFPFDDTKSRKTKISVSGVHADVPSSSSSFPPDDVVGNVTQEELDQQRELLHRFSPAKRSTPPTDSSSNYTNFPATRNSGFPFDDMKSGNTSQSIHSDPLSAATTGRTSTSGGSTPSEREYRNYAVVNVDPSDCLAPPDEVVGHISADEFQQQDKLFNQFNHQLHLREHELCNDPGKRHRANVDSSQKGYGESSEDHKHTMTNDGGKVGRVKCELHQKPFVMFCPTCNCTLCNSCLDVNSHKHVIKAAIPMRKAKEQVANSFEKQKQTLSLGQEKYIEQCERLEKDNSEILRKAEELKKQVEMETFRAHQQLDRNLEEIKNAIDQRVKQIFESRDRLKDNVDKVKHRLDEATAIIRNAADMIESEDISTAMVAKDEVLSIIREVNKTSLNPPDDAFNLDCRSRNIDRFDSSLAPVSLTTNSWAPRTYSSFNFYMGGGI